MVRSSLALRRPGNLLNVSDFYVCLLPGRLVHGFDHFLRADLPHSHGAGILAYQNSPHSRVECVQCHIGPGAGWFVKSKLSGLRQVYAVTFKTYSHPIPSPVKYLRPARETCEQCHWPQRFSGDKFMVKNKLQGRRKEYPADHSSDVKIGGRTLARLDGHPRAPPG